MKSAAINQNQLKLGKYIRTAREEKSLTLRDLAAKVLKEDGTPVTFSFLWDIEKGNRTPSEFVIKQLAAALDLPYEVLMVYGRRFPEDLVIEAEPYEIASYYRNFINRISGR